MGSLFEVALDHARLAHPLIRPSGERVYLLWAEKTVLGVFHAEGDAIEVGNLLPPSVDWRVEKRSVA